MSRLFVQNLPVYVDESRLKDHFSRQGHVTDACIVRTKDTKKSRRFGFVGYQTEAEAKAALKYFDQTFLDTCKIKVKQAQARDSSEMERPWSKYSKGSSRYEEAKAKQVDGAKKTIVDEDSGEGKVEKTKNVKNKEFTEFLEAMQPRSQSKFWANDDAINPDATKEVENKVSAAKKAIHTGLSDSSNSDAEESSSESSDDSDSNENDQRKVKSNISSMEFLKSKISKNINESEDNVENTKQKNRSAKNAGAGKNIEQEVEDESDKDTLKKSSCRLFVRNLPYTAEETDIKQEFEKFGEIVEVHLPLDEAHRKKGFGFVLFKNSVDAEKALTSLDHHAFQGRLLHVMAANAPIGQGLGENSNRNLSFKEKKEAERRASASVKTGWNSSFIRGDATVDSLASRLGVEKGDILDKETGNMAVKLAIGETLLHKENKEFFEQEGVDLNVMESTIKGGKKAKIERSTTTILVKNLPFSSEEEELSHLFGKYGNICRIVFPPSKTIAIIEFLEATEARKAFRSLSYKKYQHVPLYLEWAPLKVFSSSPSKTKRKAKEESVLPTLVDDEVSLEQNNTVCVKNLNFVTKEESLSKLFKRCGDVRKVTIAKKRNMKSKNPKDMLSMGFGFVEFSNAVNAEKAVKSLEGVMLDGHSLSVKISQKKLSNPPKRKSTTDNDNKSKTKFIVRNLAFEASRKEVSELFGSFGQLKKVRMPKKFDGSHRGFSFVEYLTEQEAKNAFSSLSSSHLYGRHLVLEWAKDEEDIQSLREKASKDLSSINGRNRSKRQKTDDFQDDMDF